MKRAITIALCAVFLIYISACSTISNTPQVEVSPAFPAAPSPEPVPASAAEQPVARYAGSYTVRGEVTLDSVVSKILLTLYNDHAVVNTFQSKGSPSNPSFYDVQRDGEEIILFSKENTSKIIIHPPDGEAETWADFNGVSLDSGGKEDRMLNLIDLGNPDKNTPTKFADYAGWQPEYAGAGGLIGIFSVLPVTQGIPCADYFAVFNDPEQGSEIVQPFWGMLYPPESGDIHLGIPMSWLGLCVAGTLNWDEFLRFDNDLGFVNNCANHKDYYQNTAMPCVFDAIGNAQNEDELYAHSRLLYAIKGVINGDFEGGGEDEVIQYITENYGKAPIVDKYAFKHFEIEPDEWVKLLEINSDMHERSALFRKYGITLNPDSFVTQGQRIDLGTLQTNEGGIDDCVVYCWDGMFIFQKKSGQSWFMSDYLDKSSRYGELQLDRVILKGSQGAADAALLYIGTNSGHGTGYFQNAAYWYNLNTHRIELSNFGSGYTQSPMMIIDSNNTEAWMIETVDFSYRVSDDETKLIFTFTYDAHYDLEDNNTISLLRGTRDVVFEWAGHLKPVKTVFPSMWDLSIYADDLRMGEGCELSDRDVRIDLHDELVKASKSSNSIARGWAKSMLE